MKIIEKSNWSFPCKTVRTDDGTIWYLNPAKTDCWPNGNPHKLFYDSVCSGRELLVRLDETGELIFISTKYCA